MDVCEFKGICIVEFLLSWLFFDFLIIIWRFVVDSWIFDFCSIIVFLLDVVNLFIFNVKNVSLKVVVNRVVL